jgi:tetratricopeptide (TPR) repeat protein
MTSPTIQQSLDLAMQHRRAGRLREAEELYRAILIQQPDHAVAMHHLGLIASQTGRGEIALELLRKVVVLNPDWPEAHSNLAKVLIEAGQFDEAIAACRRALALSPGFAEAHYNLAICLQKKGQLDEAIIAYRQAIALKPDHVKAFTNLGTLLNERGRLDEAIEAFRQAVAIDPNAAEPKSNLGNALRDKGQIDEAIAVYRQAISVNPNLPGLFNNLGAALKEKGQLDEAVAVYRQAIQIEPQAADIHLNLALLLLGMGRLAEGWEEFEWRLKDQTRTVCRDFGSPKWNGESLTGKTLFVYSEGGYGDAIQFVRFVPLLRERAGKLILECQPSLVKLFSDLPGVDEIIARGRALPAFDFQISLLSLPRLFKTDLANIPNGVPYLNVPAAEQSRWEARIQRDGRLKVGLVWAGNPHPNPRSDLRSRGLDVLAPLAHVTHVQFVSLQKGPESSVAGPPGLEIIDFTGDLNDFADTAALIANLDLVISVDTSVAHMAGALAKPAWVLIPNSADFRWLVDRTDSPWYPTMRLFRQKERGDWGSAVEELKVALQAAADSRCPCSGKETADDLSTLKKDSHGMD